MQHDLVKKFSELLVTTAYLGLQDTGIISTIVHLVLHC
jgi:hypothetical protein